jgi:hypothetical protein
MNPTLPLHRRARTWYGTRTPPTEPLRRAEPEAPVRVHVPGLRIVELPRQIRQAPFDRRLTALL